MKRVDTEIAVKRRFPEGVALVVCKDEKGMVNLTPVGWFMLCNSEPRCWAIALYKEHYSHKVISGTGEFSLCLPAFSQKENILYCGSVSGWNVDKLKKCKLKIIPSQKIKPPILEGSIACFECKVVDKTVLADHTIFVGKVLVSYTSDRKDKTYNLGDRNLFKWELKS